MSATTALVNDSARLFVSNDDSLYLYDIGRTPAALLSVRPVEQDSQKTSYPLEFKIDRKGCFYSLNRQVDWSYDSLTHESSKTVEMSYLSQCSEPTPSVDTLPDSPEGYQYTNEASFALDGEGGVHIATMMYIRRPEADAPREAWQEFYRKSGNPRLYHIFKKDGEWVFQPVNLK